MSDETAGGWTVTAGQMRAARAYLGWSLIEAATKSERSVAGVQMAEHAATLPRVYQAALAIRRTYEAAGIRFLPATAEGPGVRLCGEAR